LVLYTDGLIERRTELLTEGLDRLLRACADGPASPEALCEHLADVMFRGVVPTDDVAMLVVSVDE
jgi:hypothetical protein